MPLPPEGYENAVDVPVQRPPRFDWWGWAPEPDTTGDGSGDPDKHFITIVDDGEEMAVIVHRTVGGKYPLDGRVALKRAKSSSPRSTSISGPTSEPGAEHPDRRARVLCAALRRVSNQQEVSITMSKSNHFDPCGEFVIYDDDAQPERTVSDTKAVIQAHPEMPGHVQIGVAPAETPDETDDLDLLAMLTMSNEQFAEFLAHGQEHLATV